MESDLEAELNNLLADNESGSLEVALKAVMILNRYLDSGEDITDIAEKILEVHGEMVAVEKSIRSIMEKGAEVVNEILDELKTAGEKAGYKLAEHIEGIVTTVSRSRTVEIGIINAEKISRVYILESRPALEGIEMAKSLRKKGINCSVVVDSAMAYAVSKSNLVVFGADGVYQNGVVNKIGSLPLSLTARYCGKPVICAFPEIKVIKKGFKEKFKLRDPKEITDEVPAENVYFEFIPSELIHWVVTENGRKRFEDLFRDI